MTTELEQDLAAARRHNEELILDKKMLETRIEAQRDQFLHLIGAIVRHTRKKKMLVGPDKFLGMPAELERKPDGAVAIRISEPPVHETSDQSS